MLDQIFAYTDADLSVSALEEAALIASAQAGDDGAKMRLVSAYGPALRSAVSRFAKGIDSSDLSLDDLQSAALVALLELIETHDPAVSPRLAGRVAQHLAAALGEEFTTAAAFTVPSRTLKRFYGILKAADGDVETAEGLAPDHGMTRETFRDVLSAVRGTTSLDAGSDEDGESERGDAKPVVSASPIVDVEDRILVDLAFRAVEDDEERICRLAYGFTEYDPQPDAEIAHRMGLTRPTVQRKRAKALGSMRKALGVTHA